MFGRRGHCLCFCSGAYYGEWETKDEEKKLRKKEAGWEALKENREQRIKGIIDDYDLVGSTVNS